MTTEKVFFGETEHNLEIKPITLVFNSSVDESVYSERIMITPEMTLDHYSSLKEIDPYTARFFKIVVPDFPHEINKENLDKCGMAFQHLIGLFSMSLIFMVQNVKFGWKYPESFLHPKYQGNIADAMIAFSNQKEFIKIIVEVKENLLRGSE